MGDYQAAIAQPGNVGIGKPQELLQTLSVHRYDLSSPGGIDDFDRDSQGDIFEFPCVSRSQGNQACEPVAPGFLFSDPSMPASRSRHCGS
jgi:hypothetical protein